MAEGDRGLPIRETLGTIGATIAAIVGLGGSRGPSRQAIIRSRTLRQQQSHVEKQVAQARRRWLGSGIGSGRFASFSKQTQRLDYWERVQQAARQLGLPIGASIQYILNRIPGRPTVTQIEAGWDPLRVLGEIAASPRSHGPTRIPTRRPTAPTPPSSLPSPRAPRLPRPIPQNLPDDALLAFLRYLIWRRQQRTATHTRDRALRILRSALPPAPPVGVSPTLPGARYPGGNGMAFGQMGFDGSIDGGGGNGGFWGGVGDVLGGIVPQIPDILQSIPGIFQADPSRTDPRTGTKGRLDLSDVVGGGCEPFRMTESRIVPKNRMDFPDGTGKYITFLRATPKGWKVHASNVTGIRRHHHHNGRHHHHRPR